MSGRTTWWAKDAAWWRRGRVMRLGREFGVAGPAVLDYLMGEAKSQGPTKGHDGSVKADVAAISIACFIDDDELVERIVSKAVELGALDDFEDHGDGMFTCRMSGWKSDVEKPLAATKKAAQRAGQGVPGSPPESPGVPECPPVSEPVPLDVDVEGEGDVDKPLPPNPNVEPDDSTVIARELFEHWRTACGHPRAKLTDDRRRKIRARLREGYTVEQIRQAIDGAAARAFVNEQGVKFDDIELICRNGAKVEQFIARAAAKSPRPDGGYFDELRQMHAAATVAERQELAS